MVPIDENGAKVEGVIIEGGTRLDVSAIMLSKDGAPLTYPLQISIQMGLKGR